MKDDMIQLQLNEDTKTLKIVKAYVSNYTFFSRLLIVGLQIF